MQIWNVFILLLANNTSWHKHEMEKQVLSDQTCFLSGKSLSLAAQNLVTEKIICRLADMYIHVHFLQMSCSYNAYVAFISTVLSAKTTELIRRYGSQNLTFGDVLAEHLSIIHSLFTGGVSIQMCTHVLYLKF